KTDCTRVFLCPVGELRSFLAASNLLGFQRRLLGRMVQGSGIEAGTPQVRDFRKLFELADASLSFCVRSADGEGHQNFSPRQHAMVAASFAHRLDRRLPL